MANLSLRLLCLFVANKTKSAQSVKFMPKVSVAIIRIENRISRIEQVKEVMPSVLDGNYVREDCITPADWVKFSDASLAT